jgi:hypothetical protein
MSGRFTKGESGNPAGRPKGIRDRRTALRALLEPHADALIAKVVSLALEGDTTALRICIDRLIPSLKPQDSAVELGVLEGRLAEQGAAVLKGALAGRISPDQAGALMQALAAQARIIDTSELLQRIERLEAGQAARNRGPADSSRNR